MARMESEPHAHTDSKHVFQLDDDDLYKDCNGERDVPLILIV